MNQESDEEREPKEENETGPSLSLEDQVKALTAELDEAAREREQITGNLQRSQADLVNYRRRVEDDRDDQVKYSNGRLLANLLTVLDEFNLAIDQGTGGDAPEPWLEGVNLIYRKLYYIIESEGATRIEAEGKSFDPVEHEALAQQESSEYEEGQVVSVVRDGYKLHARVLRPAQVIVAKKPGYNTESSFEDESASGDKED